jgi:hypothetical protein
MCEAVQALNDLADGGIGARPSADSMYPRGGLLPVQAMALEEINNAMSEPPMVGDDFLPEASLSAMLRADSVYRDGSAGGLAVFGKGEISLPYGQSSATALDDVLDGEAAKDLGDISERMLLGEEELAGRIDAEGFQIFT